MSLSMAGDPGPQVPQPQPTFNLLELPLEVRVSVYERFFEQLYVVVEAPFAAYSKKSESDKWLCEVVLPETHSTTFDQDLWIFFKLSKQIAIEARPVLFESATFVFKGRKQFLDAFHRLCLPGVPQTLPDLDGKLSKFQPFSNMRRIWIDLTEHRQAGVHELPPEMCRNAGAILQILRSHMTLEEISVTFDRSAMMFNEKANKDLCMHGSLLRELCRFESLHTFRIEYVRTSADYLAMRGIARALVAEVTQKIVKMHVEVHESPYQTLLERVNPNERVVSVFRESFAQQMRRLVSNEPRYSILRAG